MKSWEKCKALATNSIIEVMRIIDSGALQIALIVDKDDKLLGIVTDGDIRRGILNGISLESPVAEIMNWNPVTVHEDLEQRLILMKMRELDLNSIPVVNHHGIIVNLFSLNELAYRGKRENWVVLMVGGLGTRLRPLTDNCPKPLLKVGNKPILETIIENFIEEGFYKFYLAVNYKADMIERYFGDGSNFGIKIKYIREKKRMGTVGALSLLPEKMKDPVIVMNGDLLTKVNFGQLLDYHKEQNAMATMAVREYTYQIPYGVIQFSGSKIVAIEEKPMQSFFVNAGIYVLSPKAVEKVAREKIVDMPDLFNTIIKKGQVTAAFPIREYWVDIGKMDDFEKAQDDFKDVFE